VHTDIIPSLVCTSAGSLLRRLSGRLADGGITALRHATPADRDFLMGLFRSFRGAMFEAMPLPENVRAALIHQQSEIFLSAFRAVYPDADDLIVTRAGIPSGRMVIGQTGLTFHLTEIVLMPESRGQGLGGRLVRALCACAAEDGRSVTLEVQPANPARRLYAALGFQISPDAPAFPVSIPMIWRPGNPPSDPNHLGL